MLETYCDRSETHDRFLTLGTLTAAHEDWSVFEPKWSAALANHNAPGDPGKPYFHATELYAPRGPFGNWTREQRRSLLTSLLNLIPGPAWNGIVRASCTVDLSAWKSVRQDCPTIPKPAALCINGVFKILMNHPEISAGVEIYLDQNEKFEGRVRELRHHAYLKGLVSAVRVVGREQVKIQPMQAADLLAWLMNRYHASSEKDVTSVIAAMSATLSNQYHVFLTESDLRAGIDPQTGESWGARYAPTKLM